MPLDYIRMGAELRAAREAKGLTQPEIARKLGMTASNLSRIEKGAVTPIENIERYAAIVGCRVAVVFATPGNRLGLLAARLAYLVQGMDPVTDASLIDTLSAWADSWEAKQKARRSGS